MCGVYRQKITFECEFHTQSFFTDTTDTLELPSFNIITEEITVSPEERKFFANERQTFITDLVRRHPSIISEPNKYTIRNNLVPNIPVKCIHWFLRNTKFEDEGTIKEIGENDEELFYVQNRFNFSSNVSFDEIQTFFDPIMESASFYINGTKMPNVTQTTHNYYKYLVPLHNRLARPFRNIYTYSFSMNPVNVEPSGNLDFSQIQSEKTNIEVTLDQTEVDTSSNTYSLNMYYTGYQTFVFDKGFMSIAY